MSCKGIRLVFAKGSSDVELPAGDPDERLGPVLASLAAGVPGEDGTHTVNVKEIPSAVLGTALTNFITNGKLPPSTDPLLLAPAYKAAERLNIAGMVRAIEKATVASIAAGDVRIDEVAAIFVGCPRIAALCDNYLNMPGARPPPPFKLLDQLPDLAAAHGALLLVGTRSSRYMVLDEFWVLADIATCHKHAREHGRRSCPRDIFCVVSLGNESRKSGLCLFTIKSVEDLSEFEELHPRNSETWITDDQGHASESQRNAKGGHN